MTICDVCGIEKDNIKILSYALKLIEEGSEDGDDQVLKRHDLDLCDQCIEKIMPVIKGVLKHRDDFSINSYLKGGK